MPKLGLTMTEGVLAEWRVASGDPVTPGQVLFVVETDKIANEIEAQVPGTVAELLAVAGTTLPVGAPVAVLLADGETALAPAPAPQRRIATPLARRMARQSGQDLAAIAGSGPGGRIMARDLADVPAAPPAPEPAPHVIQPDSFRRTTARRLSEAKRDIPHFYVFAAADVTDLLALRAQLNTGSGPRLSVTHFLLAAAARTLAAMPAMNRVWAADAIHQLALVDVGLAVESPKGLVAPVLRNLATQTLDEVAAATDSLIATARAGKVTGADLSGGALSISNVGMFGVSALVPIINPGQSGILGVGAAQPRFLPDDQGRPALRQVLELALSCDHRVIDGALAARFLAALARALESPATLLRRP
ncbi:MAG: 2-oxo acid dehydrogenase subunit E2 [Sphingomonadales bacterium]|nr:2-oxo acid dehydrogenase subunit E2 [Sphingomonadales bacterium]